jgi:hypothetical protein
MPIFCNPLNVPYHYQFNADLRNNGVLKICREAADPSMILFHGRYWIFPSMNLSVWVSDDLAHWESRPLPESLPLYDYAPDVRVLGDWVYFSASSRDHNCSFFRTKDILNGPYEEIPGSFPFWDPNLFLDDDGRVYFYWGCSSMEPIYGVELDPETMQPITERRTLIEGRPYQHGFERFGENNTILPASDAEIEQKFQGFLKMRNMTESMLPPGMANAVKGMFAERPFIEGAWMTKHAGKYYLQYAFPGTQFNVYGDGVYVSDQPLGPFTMAENAPFSFHPGGFLPGAGHGSTMEDREGAWWHTATMRISMNHDFERRVGLWPAGFDADGELFCNQRFGDWPQDSEKLRRDPWAEPDWMLLSAGKRVTASSHTPGHEPEKAAEENVQTWWQAETNAPGEWLRLDLGRIMDVRAVQVNFADDKLDIPSPGPIQGSSTQPRYIDPSLQRTRWLLEVSGDGERWTVLEDKTESDTDLSHDLVVREEGVCCRYLRLTVRQVPYAQRPCVSGLRVFGRVEGEKPAQPEFNAERVNVLDMRVSICQTSNVLGYNILWGHASDKLYHSWTVYAAGEQRVGALVEGRDYYVRVDAFNECGLTEGTVQKL